MCYVLLLENIIFPNPWGKLESFKIFQPKLSALGKHPSFRIFYLWLGLLGELESGVLGRLWCLHFLASVTWKNEKLWYLFF